MPGDQDHSRFHQHLMEETLVEVFGQRDRQLLDRLLPRLTTIELQGGAVLMRQGDPSDSIYLVLSGRLQASVLDPEKGRVVLGDIGRGEPIGEMGVITGSPRSATVHASRDCILARLNRQDFAETLESWPRAGLPLARKLIERLSHVKRPGRKKPVVNICVLPLHGSLDGVSLAGRLRATLESEFSRTGKPAAIAMHERKGVESSLGIDVATAESDAQGDYRRLLNWLDKQEAGHHMQVFAAHADDTPWTRLCLRHADLVLLVADADGDARLTDAEQRHLAGDKSVTAARPSLWLLHPDDRPRPRGTDRWLRDRPYLAGDGMSHFHCRRERDSDWRRLARIVSGQACGLVLAGGGARGFAHLGVMRALQERGIEWDLVGGTSIGAVMGAYAAMDLPVEAVTDFCQQAAARKPTGDLNLLPMMSLLRGRRLQRVIEDAIAQVLGDRPHVEDLWKPYFCVASNYSRHRAEVLRHGELSEALLASVAVPAALPPVVRNGDLLLDGGTFNNYPVDIMRASGAARVIGVDLSREDYRPLSHKAAPSPWALFIDRFFRPRAKRRLQEFPGLGTIVVNVAVMASISHQKRMRDLVDLGFQPDVADVGLLDWASFRSVVELGFRHAHERLAAEAPSLAQEWCTGRVGGTAPGPRQT